MKAKTRIARTASLPSFEEIKDELKGEYLEGAEVAARFNALAQHVLSISHEEMMRREEAYQREAALNPNRRGPKPKPRRRAAKPRGRT